MKYYKTAHIMWTMWIKISLTTGLMVLGASSAYADARAPIPVPKPGIEKKHVQKASILNKSTSAVQDQKKNPEKEAIPYPAVKPALVTKTKKSGKKTEYAFTNYNLNRALSSADTALYRKIFKKQDNGDFVEAEELIAKLTDTRLLGHVLYQRYRHEAYKSSYPELQKWMAHYADHPGASDIYELAKRKAPVSANTKALTKPEKVKSIAVVREPTVQWAKAYKSRKKRNQMQHKEVFKLKRILQKHLGKGNLTYVQKLLKTDSRAVFMDQVEKDMVLARVANAYYYRGKRNKAYKLAKETLRRSASKVPLSAWVAGLVSWRKGHYKSAAGFFEIAGRSGYASGWTSSAGAFWAARAHMKSGNIKKVSTWLDKASKHPRTFYGLLATRALGKDFDFNWALPQLSKNHEAILTAIPAGARAIALVKIGQRQRAQNELLRLDIAGKTDVAQALMIYAQHARLPKLSVRIGNVLSSKENGFYDAAMYPAGPWKPKDGYTLDPALIYAVLRQESHFNPEAQSPSGARGLMQVMPATAKSMGLKKGQDLLDPSTNLNIAQAYIRHLFKYKPVKGDIARMLVAYNAGPGNLNKWLKQMGNINDPLLFIESVPVAETRTYVERVLSNYWIYQRRQGLKTPSLTQLAQGKWASYTDMQKIQPYQTVSN